MFKTKELAVPAAPTTVTPPTVEEVYMGAQASSAYARHVFTDVIDSLVQANVDLDDVVMRATSEIDRLAQLVEDAQGDRRTNTKAIESIQALIG